VTEAVVLVVAATTLGLAWAYWTAEILISMVPANMLAKMPFLDGLGFNSRVAIFAAAITTAAAILFALTPMFHLILTRGRNGLVEGSRGAAGTAWRRVGSKLVVVELATAVILLVGAGLLGKSLYQLLHVDLGMQPDHLAAVTLAAPPAYAKEEQLVVLAEQILERIAALPGVTSVGAASRAPLNAGNTMWIRVVGRPYHGEHNEVQYREVSPGYFATLKARLLRGRHFTGHDDAVRPSVVIVNRALADRYFPDEDPIGKQLLYASSSDQPPMHVIGIIDDLKEGPLDTATAPTMYVAFAQDPTSGFTVIARTSQTEESVLPAMIAAIHDIDPGIPTFFPTSMTQAIKGSPSAYVRSSSATLVGGFAALAWVLGVIGLYGVVAYSVSQRTREIGVRIALGAGRSSVYQLILREAGWLIAAGIAIGLAASLATARLIQGLLFGVSPWDVSTLATVGGVLGISALLASLIPARRAASVNPVDALRAE
jgi:macrolide transport system ATP-binding/permease protein